MDLGKNAGLETFVENRPRQSRENRIGRRDIFRRQMLAEFGRATGDDFGAREFF